MSRSTKLLTLLVMLFFLGLALFFLFGVLLSGDKLYTYSNKNGETVTVRCAYGVFSTCDHGPTKTLDGQTLYLTSSVDYSNLELSSGYRAGTNKKRYCLSANQSIRQLKSAGSGLYCSKNDVLVEPGKCYREDYRDPGYEC